MIEYNAPIITREEHEVAMYLAHEQINHWRQEVNKLQHGLPAGEMLVDISDDEDDDEDFDDEPPDF
jgi:hypothetical protein